MIKEDMLGETVEILSGEALLQYCRRLLDLEYIVTAPLTTSPVYPNLPLRPATKEAK